MKMKPLYFLLLSIAAMSCASDAPAGEGGEYDARAIEHLDQLTAVVGELKSASFTLDVVDLEKNRQHDIYLRGPDIIYFHSTDIETGLRTSLWFNGSEISLFRYEDMNYAEIEAPGRIMEAIELMSSEYGVEFPAADFFYPTLTDDLLQNYDNLWYLGEATVDDTPTFLVQATTKEEVISIWIDAETHLPFMMAIAAPGQESNSYEVVFSNWQVDPVLPDILFEFDAPEGSVEVEFGSKN